ncbi:acyltransferase [Catenovulum sp. SM1970]|nr:acyltransferase [Marinifaba aquimaris]
MSMNQTKQWLKTSDQPIAKTLFKIIKAIRQFELPAPKLIYLPLYHGHKFITNTLSSLARITYWTPLFKSQIKGSAKRLYLYGGMPFLSGGIDITVGDDCRISGQSTFSGRVHGAEPAKLILGNNIDIGWMTTIASGTKVVIEDNVRIAGRAFFAGYPGHPLDAQARAEGAACLDSQAKDIILKKDVWLATGVSVMAGVTIGEGTIVAAGSVVTRDLPANVLAAGSPAKVIKQLN